MKQLGEKIQGQRKRYKLSQAELAQKTGISRTSLSQLESGAITDIGIRKVMRILEYLGLELTVRPAGAPPTLDELKKEMEAEKRRS
ncbi:MAG: helix-turn-helix transcriptional regulator [Nitrospirae bacterium]|nr:helix-turn-helix transcriptional regulator [Nitrospirota bacterium]